MEYLLFMLISTLRINLKQPLNYLAGSFWVALCNVVAILYSSCITEGNVIVV